MGCSFGKQKKIISIVNTFQKVLDKSEGCKPNKILVDKVVNFMINQGNDGCKTII